MNKFAIILNGPPRSGKDTIGRLLADAIPYSRCVKFASRLKKATHAMVDQLMGFGQRPVIEDEHEHEKEKIAIAGKTWRECYIGVSELLCKPMFGSAFFGSMLASDIAQSTSLISIVTDGGFVEEFYALRALLGRDNILVVKVSRPGCDFSRDSRGYLPYVGDRLIENDGTLHDLHDKTRIIVDWALSQPEIGDVPPSPLPRRDLA